MLNKYSANLLHIYTKLRKIVNFWDSTLRENWISSWLGIMYKSNLWCEVLTNSSKFSKPLWIQTCASKAKNDQDERKTWKHIKSVFIPSEIIWFNSLINATFSNCDNCKPHCVPALCLIWDFCSELLCFFFFSCLFAVIIWFFYLVISLLVSFSFRLCSQTSWYIAVYGFL